MSQAILPLSPAENLPRDVLGYIFGIAIYNAVDRHDMCQWCDRPYVYCIRSPTSAAIQLTCRKWYQTWRHAYLLTAFFANQFPWCVHPHEHLLDHARHVVGKVTGIATLPFIIVPTLEEDGSEGAVRVLPVRCDDRD